MGKNQKLFLSIFISLTLCIVFTILVSSAVLYVNFQSIALTQVYSSNMNSLMQTSRDVSNMTNTAVTLSNQIYSDLNVARLLYYANPEVFDIRSAMDQLTNYRLSLPFIDSIYVYNGKTSTIYVNASGNRNTNRDTIQPKKDFDDKAIISILDDFDKYKQYIPIPRKFDINSEEGIKKYYYTFLHYDAFTGKNLDSAVIVNISEDWLHRVISDGSVNKGSETFIIDRKGILVSNSRVYSMMSDISSERYIKKIINGQSISGYFIDTVNGKKSLLTYTEPDALGWIYIRVTPWNILFSRIEKMKTTTILTGLGILVFGILISILVSRKLYVPIDTMLANLKSLEAEKRSNVEILRQGLLKDIILGREAGNGKDILKKLTGLGMKIDVDDSFRVVLLKIDNYSNFYEQYNPEDRGLFRFAIMNICTEMFSKDFKTDAIDMGEGNIVILLHYSPDNSPSNSFEDLLKSVHDAVLNYLKISVSITVSSIEKSIESIYILHRQVQEAALHRLFYGHGSIIYADNAVKFKANEYNYPLQKEKLLIDALMGRKTEEAKQIYNEIVYDTSQFPFSVINLAVSRLVFSINNAVNTIKKNNSLLADFETDIPAMPLNNAETIEDINVQFYALFEELNKRLEERKNLKHEELISKIHEIIDNQYTDPDLSIDSLAESLGLSPTYMCRLYKQYTLSTILDRVVEIRMKNARELLLKTEYSIAEIAEKIGFTNSSYFYKAFKKINGTTPNDFRKNLQSS